MLLINGFPRWDTVTISNTWYPLPLPGYACGETPVSWRPWLLQLSRQDAGLRYFGRPRNFTYMIQIGSYEPQVTY